MNDLSERGSDFVGDLGEAVRRNPLSAALIGMGILWLFTGNRPIERAGDVVRGWGLDRIPDAAGNALDATRSVLTSGVGSIGGRVISAKDAVQDHGADVLDNVARFGQEQVDPASEYALSIPEYGAEMFDTVRSNLNDLFKAQPLALGAIGIAIGAGVAAALPSSEVEAAYIGETSDTVKAKAAEFAVEQTDRATTIAKNVMEAVVDESRRQGLTVEGGKEAVGAISAKVGRVVDTAKKGVSARATLTRSSS
jgi:hypothetical protein